MSKLYEQSHKLIEKVKTFVEIERSRNYNKYFAKNKKKIIN